MSTEENDAHELEGEGQGGGTGGTTGNEASVEDGPTGPVRTGAAGGFDAPGTTEADPDDDAWDAKPADEERPPDDA